MIDFLHKTLGGCKKIKSLQTHCRKTQYVWNVRGFESCMKVLEKVIPFLILKKKQGKILFNYIKNPRETNPDSERLKIQSLNNESLIAYGNVAKQSHTNSEIQTFWAYFSGILDTEGSFSIRKNKPSWGCKNYKYNPLIQLSMASFESMNFIRQNMCLGSVCFPKAKSTQRGYTYKYLFGSVVDCIDLINRTLPYLRFKKDVALELLNFCENYSVVTHKRAGISDKELQFREGCYQKIKQLNESGIVKPSLIDSETPKQGDEGQG
jgi:hypothetical protein